jgi:hypothetical protein
MYAPAWQAAEGGRRSPMIAVQRLVFAECRHATPRRAGCPSKPISPYRPTTAVAPPKVVALQQAAPFVASATPAVPVLSSLPPPFLPLLLIPRPPGSVNTAENTVGRERHRSPRSSVGMRVAHRRCPRRAGHDSVRPLFVPRQDPQRQALPAKVHLARRPVLHSVSATRRSIARCPSTL